MDSIDGENVRRTIREVVKNGEATSTSLLEEAMLRYVADSQTFLESLNGIRCLTEVDKRPLSFVILPLCDQQSLLNEFSALLCLFRNDIGKKLLDDDNSGKASDIGNISEKSFSIFLSHRAQTDDNLFRFRMSDSIIWLDVSELGVNQSSLPLRLGDTSRCVLTSGVHIQTGPQWRLRVEYLSSKSVENLIVLGDTTRISASSRAKVNRILHAKEHHKSAFESLEGKIVEFIANGDNPALNYAWMQRVLEVVLVEGLLQSEEKWSKVGPSEHMQSFDDMVMIDSIQLVYPSLLLDPVSELHILPSGDDHLFLAQPHMQELVTKCAGLTIVVDEIQMSKPMPDDIGEDLRALLARRLFTKNARDDIRLSCFQIAPRPGESANAPGAFSDVDTASVLTLLRPSSLQEKLISAMAPLETDRINAMIVRMAGKLGQTLPRLNASEYLAKLQSTAEPKSSSLDDCLGLNEFVSYLSNAQGEILENALQAILDLFDAGEVSSRLVLEQCSKLVSLRQTPADVVDLALAAAIDVIDSRSGLRERQGQIVEVIAGRIVAIAGNPDALDTIRRGLSAGPSFMRLLLGFDFLDPWLYQLFIPSKDEILVCLQTFFWRLDATQFTIDLLRKPWFAQIARDDVDAIYELLIETTLQVVGNLFHQAFLDLSETSNASEFLYEFGRRHSKFESELNNALVTERTRRMRDWLSTLLSTESSLFTKLSVVDSFKHGAAGTDQQAKIEPMLMKMKQMLQALQAHRAMMSKFALVFPSVTSSSAKAMDASQDENQRISSFTTDFYGEEYSELPERTHSPLAREGTNAPVSSFFLERASEFNQDEKRSSSDASRKRDQPRDLPPPPPPPPAVDLRQVLPTPDSIVSLRGDSKPALRSAPSSKSAVNAPASSERARVSDDDGDGEDEDEEAQSAVSEEDGKGTGSFSSRRVSRYKYAYTLHQICSSAKPPVSVEDARMMVCQGRKVVYVVSYGEIDSLHCFFDRKPTPSYRHPDASGRRELMLDSEWNVVVVPNGWKVAVIVNDETWVAETLYKHDESTKKPKLLYGFTRYDDEGKPIGETHWNETPGAAFKGAVEKTEKGAHENRHNGRLYVGISYEHPQQVLRDVVAAKLQQNQYDSNPRLKARISEWVASRSKRQPIFYVVNSRGVVEGTTQGDAALPSSSSSAAVAPAPSEDVGRDVDSVASGGTEATFIIHDTVQVSYESLLMSEATELPPAVAKTVRSMLAAIPTPAKQPSRWTLLRVKAFRGSQLRMAQEWLRPCEVRAIFTLTDEVAMAKMIRDSADGRDVQVKVQSRITLEPVLRILALDDTAVSEAALHAKYGVELSGTDDFVDIASRKYKFHSVLKIMHELETFVSTWLDEPSDIRLRVLRGDPSLNWPAEKPVPVLSVRDMHRLPMEARLAYFVARAMEDYQLYPVMKSLRESKSLMFRLITRLPDVKEIEQFYLGPSCKLMENSLEVLNQAIKGRSAQSDSVGTRIAPPRLASTAANVMSRRGPTSSSSGALAPPPPPLPASGARSALTGPAPYMSGRFSRTDFVETLVAAMNWDLTGIAVFRSLNVRGVASHLVPLLVTKRDADIIVDEHAATLKALLVCWKAQLSSRSEASSALEAIVSTVHRLGRVKIVCLVPAGSPAETKIQARKVLGAAIAMSTSAGAQGESSATIGSAEAQDVQVEEWIGPEEVDKEARIAQIVSSCGAQLPLPVKGDAELADAADAMASKFADDSQKDTCRVLAKELRANRVILLLAPIGMGKSTLLAAGLNVRLGRDLNIGAAYFFNADCTSLVDAFRSIAIQLCACFGGLAKHVAARRHRIEALLDRTEVTREEAIEAFKAVIEEPCVELDRERKVYKRVTIVLDGVDRLDSESYKTLGSCIQQSQTPSWVCFLVSARPVVDIRESFFSPKVVSIDYRGKAHGIDIFYCLEDNQWPREEIQRLDLATRSEGNFLWCAELSKAFPDPVQRRALAPGFAFDGMSAVWEAEVGQAVDDIMLRSPAFATQLYLSLLVSRDPLPDKIWHDFAKRNADTALFDESRKKLSRVVVFEHNAVRSPHSSFVEWLSRKIGQGPNAEQKEAAHASMARIMEAYVKTTYKSSHKVWRVLATNAMYHWTQARRLHEAVSWLDEPAKFWSLIHASSEIKQLDRLVGDLDAVLALLSDESHAEFANAALLRTRIEFLSRTIRAHTKEIETEPTRVADLIKEEAATAGSLIAKDSGLIKLSTSDTMEPIAGAEGASVGSSSASAVLGASGSKITPQKRARGARAGSSDDTGKRTKGGNSKRPEEEAEEEYFMPRSRGRKSKRVSNASSGPPKRGRSMDDADVDSSKLNDLAKAVFPLLDEMKAGANSLSMADDQALIAASSLVAMFRKGGDNQQGFLM